MGVEYILQVPAEAQAALVGPEGERLRAELRRLVPEPDSQRPSFMVTMAPEGLYICDYLGNRAIAAQALGEAVMRLLSRADSVVVKEM